jgi:hypothetical protein
MSIPTALSGFFYNNGEVNSDAVSEIMPDGFSGTPEQFAFRVASTFKLSDNFIEDNFEFLNLRTLFIVNRVHEEIVMSNYKSIADAILEEMRLSDDEEDEDIDLIIRLLDKGYSTRVYDAVFGEVFYVLERDENVDSNDSIWDEMSDAINERVELFGFAFVMQNISKVKFNLLNAALLREDMQDEPFENLDKISSLDLYTVLTRFESLPNDDGGRRAYTDGLTRFREDLVKDILYTKIQGTRQDRR